MDAGELQHGGFFMIINHNLSAMFANRQLGVNETTTNDQMQKLASGMRINKAADDASGLAVSEKMRNQIRGLDRAGRNIQDGVSFIQTTEGYLQETQDILQRMRELAVQSANGIYTSDDRQMIQVEVSQLVDEINRVASHAQFNGLNMLTGAFAASSAMKIQVGANMDQNKQIIIGTMTAAALQLTGGADQNAGFNLLTGDAANKGIGTIDNALKLVSQQRANLGAYQNRFTEAANGVAIAAENTQAAESRIRDTDMASMMVDYTKERILDQAGIAMLAQANVRNQGVLQLLQG
jgi:flagellin